MQNRGRSLPPPLGPVEPPSDAQLRQPGQGMRKGRAGVLTSVSRVAGGSGGRRDAPAPSVLAPPAAVAGWLRTCCRSDLMRAGG
jgi:hypothetical protein